MQSALRDRDCKHMATTLLLIAVALVACTADAARAVPPDPAKAAAKPHASAAVYNVRDYGATGQRDAKATSAIQRAIDAAVAAGGGTVVLPPGEYTSAALSLKSNVTLQLDAGATLLASRDKADWPEQSAGGLPRCALLAADGATGVTLRGRGTIDGQAEFEYIDLRHSDPIIVRETEIARRAGVPLKRWYRLRPYVDLVVLNDCKHVRVEGLRLINSAGWTLTARRCEHVQFRDLYVVNDLDKATNCDGIDLVSCRDATVSGCAVSTGDDAICLKSGGFPGPVHPCENIIVSDCIATSTSAALKLGSDSHGGFRNIRFHNCIVRDSNRGLCVDLRDGGETRDVTFSDITVECNRKEYFWWGSGEPIYVAVTRRRPDSPLATVEGLAFRNVTARGQGTSEIRGLTGERRLGDITLDNVRLRMEAESRPDKRATDALVARTLDRMVLRNVEITWDEAKTELQWQSALRVVDVKRLELDGVVTRQSPARATAAAIEIDAADDVLLRHCRALPGTTTFLRLMQPPKGGLRQEDNDLRAAAKANEIGTTSKP